MLGTSLPTDRSTAAAPERELRLVTRDLLVTGDRPSLKFGGRGMGLLTVGEPLSLEEGKEYFAYIRKHGILQFLHVWNQVKSIENDSLRYA